MRRVAVIVMGMLVGVVAITGVMAAVVRDPTDVGEAAYSVRTSYYKRYRRRFPDRPLVAWFGDSTIYQKLDPYPARLQRRVLGGLRIESWNLSHPGFDQYVHYMLMARVLDYDPAAVFIVANPRLLNTEGSGVGLLQLSTMLPRSELSRALRLPWHARAITLPRLLLARALQFSPIESTTYFLEGVRAKFREFLYRTTPDIEPFHSVGHTVKAFDIPLSANSPSVQMLAAAVSVAARRGVPCTVVVSPVPVGVLRRWGHYGPRFRKRIDLIRTEVERAGGELLDLHNALVAEEFKDWAGHYIPAGAARIADLLAPDVERRVREGLRRKPKS